jgi:MAF protein
MGKPVDEAEAERMLRSLRGQVHGVVTGVAVLDTRTGMCQTISRSSDVHLREYSDDEMMAYIASGEPMDKAGAYAAQDQNFRSAIRIDGCYLNVVGLPLCDTIALLGRMGVETGIRTGWKIPEECENCELSYAAKGQVR